jgi:hypothetical protein
LTGEAYARILDRFYRSAKQSVFATSNKQYMEFWRQPESRNILNAHKAAYDRCRATVTRVFVFDSIGEVSADDLDLMRGHRNDYIRAKAFIANEAQTGSLASALLKDFVIIDMESDDQVVGITSSFERGAMGAKWTLGDEPEIERAAEFIRDNCIDLTELEARMKA